jgi:hypothetical protein
VLAALDFHELGYQRPTTAVEVSLDGLALRFEANRVVWADLSQGLPRDAYPAFPRSTEAEHELLKRLIRTVDSEPAAFCAAISASARICLFSAPSIRTALKRIRSTS